jgi:hypothetical protein
MAVIEIFEGSATHRPIEGDRTPRLCDHASIAIAFVQRRVEHFDDSLRVLCIACASDFSSDIGHSVSLPQSRLGRVFKKFQAKLKRLSNRCYTFEVLYAL